MYSKIDFKKLTSQHGTYASWAIWNKENVFDTSIIDKNLAELHSNYVLIGFNPSHKFPNKPWSNFHDNSSSRRLKVICKNNKLYGSYMTDLIKDIFDSNSKRVEKGLIKTVIRRNVKRFNLEMKDIKIYGDTKFIIFGSTSLNIFNKYFKQYFKNQIISYSHYSYRFILDDKWITGFIKEIYPKL